MVLLTLDHDNHHHRHHLYHHHYHRYHRHHQHCLINVMTRKRLAGRDAAVETQMVMEDLLPR